MNSSLESQFINTWTFYYDIPLTQEYRFHKTRKYRFDFAHVPTKVAIEINGGRWQKSGHSSGKGLLRDYEKNNLAILEGWVVFQICDEMINQDHLSSIANFIQKNLK